MAASLSSATAQNIGLYVLTGKTMIYKTVTANNATVAMHTVTAGKTFYLAAVLCTYYATGDNHIGLVHVGADPDNRLLSVTSFVEATYHPTDSGHFAITYPLPIPVGSGVVINALSDNATMSFYPTIIGWEE